MKHRSQRIDRGKERSHIRHEQDSSKNLLGGEEMMDISLGVVLARIALTVVQERSEIACISAHTYTHSNEI